MRRTRRSSAGCVKGSRTASGWTTRTDSSTPVATSNGWPRRRGGAYVLVEKILEHAATDHPERLPAWWLTDGTTGYDAMAEIDRVLIDPAGERMLDLVDAAARSESGQGPAEPWTDLIHATKRTVADESQAAEVRRLVRCLPEGIDRSGAAQDALAELLACFPVYRSYLPAGAAGLEAAAAEASVRRPDLAAQITALIPVLADPALEVARRFQQVTGPVMAKGVEDMAFYRQNRLGTAHRGGRRPIRVRPIGRRLPSRADGPTGFLAAHDDHPVDARHEARRGRARPALGHRRALARRVGRDLRRVARSGHHRARTAGLPPLPGGDRGMADLA